MGQAGESKPPLCVVVCPWFTMTSPYSNHELFLFMHCEHKRGCSQHLFKLSEDGKKSFVYISVNLFVRSLCTRLGTNKNMGNCSPVALTQWTYKVQNASFPLKPFIAKLALSIHQRGGASGEDSVNPSLICQFRYTDFFPIII